MANIPATMEGLEENFDMEDEGDFDDQSLEEEILEEDLNIIEKSVGDEIELKTLNCKITGVEEKDPLQATYSDKVTAKEGAKFVVVGMEITNTTKTQFTFPDEFLLIDNEGREFNTYADSFFVIDDYLNERDLPPSIKEKGYLVYEVPTDSTNYYTLMRKAETDDVYKVILK